ncbi:MAG TPA: hypothetical protein EYQ58_04050 [Candidatus Poseidoniales archaeon]|nr:hypothetical protein [Candidatus Poseidoniales archaeon]
MGILEVQHSVKYPPFEAHRLVASELPISKKRETLSEEIDQQQAIELVTKSIPSFKIGEKTGWLVERRYLFDGNTIKNEVYEHGIVDDSEWPIVVEKQRRGWYLTPHPVHATARKFINGVVYILLISLLYLFIEPILSAIGIPGIGTGTVRIGLLDYPLLALIVGPLFFIPLLMRVTANFSDLRRQKLFLQNPPPNPEIEIIGEAVADQDLKVKVKFESNRDNWNSISVYWRVGALPPARDAVFSALNRTVEGQPPPGLTTKLPHHWEVGLDDGTGAGEDAPMQRQEVAGGLFLRPMRVMQFGGKVEYNEDEMILENPKNTWPGTTISPLVKIHWEIIIQIERENEGSLLWVEPLRVKHSSKHVEQKTLTVNDGRTESEIL